MEQWTLDEVARTTEQQAVRVRFDAHNLGWVRVIAWTSLFVAAPGAIAALSSRAWLKSIAVVIAVAAIILAIRTTRRSATGNLARTVREHVSASVIGWCVLMTTLAALAAARSEGIVAVAVMFALAMLGLRMVPAELISLHGLMAAIAIAIISLAPPTRNGSSTAPLIFSVAFMNGLALTVELLMSRRWKREIVRDWDERRRNAQEQLRMRDELHYAREIQLSMLPEAPPQLEWLDVAGLSLPASEVGGDYYDYLEVGDALAIVTGDVAGHGLASGIVLAALRGGFTLLRDGLRDPAMVLQRLHELVAQTSRRRMLVTCAVVLLDPKSQRATVASAGHPPLLVRRGSGEVERLELFAPPLGVRLPLHIASKSVAFASGDVFVLHSDGVYESRNAAGEPYGLERLERLVASADGWPASAICDAITSDLDQFRAGVPQDDDVTLVVARVR